MISPLVFGLFGALLVVAGLVANAVDRIGDARLGGTVFEEAATLLVAYGTVVAVVGAFVYWCPKWTGRLADDRKVLPLALLAAAGAVLAAGSMAIAGFAKQPGMTNIFDYSGPKSLWNVLNAVGHVLVAVAVLGVVALRLNALRSGPAAGDDPWDGQTLEWATSSPAPTDNFAAVHTVVSPEPLIDLKPGGHAR